MERYVAYEIEENAIKISKKNYPMIEHCGDVTVLKDILQPFEEAEEYVIKDGRLKWLLSESGQKSIQKRFTSLDPVKAQCLTARSEPSWNCNYVTQNGVIRKLTPIEYERLQTLPDNYTSGVNDLDRYKALGNGWTVDVIAHIFAWLKAEQWAGEAI